MKLGADVAAIVTGGASGLGEATARRLHAHGVRVAIFDFDSERGEAIASDLGGHFSKVDVSNEESLDAAFAAARAAQGVERVLVNCAGVAVAGRTARENRKTGEIEHIRSRDLLPNIAVNLVGSLLCGARSAAGMLTLDTLNEDGERGLIVHVASTEAVEGKAGFAAYSASKGGVLGMTLPMARDLQGSGIRVNTILPGFFRTGPRMIGEGPQAKAYHDMLVSETLFPKRAGRPDEFAHLVQHLAENSYINGASIRIDAGQRLG
jgi:NAD(P)-dependent dehydrogenase (short-subunit alcohol dehydrogenase family)